MLVKVQGFRQMDFKGSDGKQVKGTTLYASYPEDGVTGEVTDKFFIKPEVSIPKGVAIGKTLDIGFNRRGKVETIVLTD